jgi:YD repeat-containing protein
MQRVVIFIMVFILSIGAYAQSRTQPTTPTTAGPRDAFEVRHSVFFDDMSLDEFTVSSWNPNFTQITRQSRFSASEAMLEQVEFSYDETRGHILSRITRDVEARIRSRIAYQYRPLPADSSPNRLWRESLVGPNGRAVSVYEYAYDSRGNVISRSILNRANDLLAQTIFTFDAQGRMTASETKDAGGNTISSTRYSYDGQGNLVAQQVSNASGEVTSNIRSVFQNNLETRNEMIGADGTLNMRIINEYGNDNELQKRTIENFQGESKQFIQYQYEFRPRRQS